MLLKRNLHLLSYLPAYKVFPPHVRRRYLCAYKAPISMALWTKAITCDKAGFKSRFCKVHKAGKKHNLF